MVTYEGKTWAPNTKFLEIKTYFNIIHSGRYKYINLWICYFWWWKRIGPTTRISTAKHKYILFSWVTMEVDEQLKIEESIMN